MITHFTTGVTPYTYTGTYEDGKEVWPCRCGQTHRGEYGKADWQHHECFHDEILLLDKLPGEKRSKTGLCTACGKPVAIVYPIPQKQEGG